MVAVKSVLSVLLLGGCPWAKLRLGSGCQPKSH